MQKPVAGVGGGFPFRERDECFFHHALDGRPPGFFSAAEGIGDSADARVVGVEHLLDGGLFQIAGGDDEVVGDVLDGDEVGSHAGILTMVGMQIERALGLPLK